MLNTNAIMNCEGMNCWDSFGSRDIRTEFPVIWVCPVGSNRTWIRPSWFGGVLGLPAKGGLQRFFRDRLGKQLYQVYISFFLLFFPLFFLPFRFSLTSLRVFIDPAMFNTYAVMNCEGTNCWDSFGSRDIRTEFPVIWVCPVGSNRTWIRPSWFGGVLGLPAKGGLQRFFRDRLGKQLYQVYISFLFLPRQ